MAVHSLAGLAGLATIKTITGGLAATTINSENFTEYTGHVLQPYVKSSLLLRLLCLLGDLGLCLELVCCVDRVRGDTLVSRP